MIELLIAALVLALVLFPIWTIVRILALGRENNALAQRLVELEIQLSRLTRPAPPPSPAPATPPPTQPRASAVAPEEASPLASSAPPIVTVPSPAAVSGRVPEPAAPPLVIPEPTTDLPAAPPRLPEPEPMTAPVAPARTPAFNWEQFMGAKLFAWLGGLTAFLAAAFFVKYSFEHDLIPPQVRVAIGFLFAIGLVVAGLKIPRQRYAVTAQTLVATGVVSLYGVTFASNSVYHFAFFGPIATFLVMSLITATAFLLAVRLEARVVAVLGILGGFLTPVLLSTGQDNPGGLFGYVALLDLGLIAVALHRRWHFLVPLGAAGTVIMQVGWALEFFVAAKAYVAIAVCLGFSALFLATYFAARRRAAAADTAASRLVPRELAWSAVALPLVALAFAFSFLTHPALAARPGLLFTFALCADAALLALAWFDEGLPKLHLVAGAVLFALLGAWTIDALTPALLPWGLCFYLAHAALHSAFPLVLERRRPAAAPTWWSQLFPPLTLLLLLGPVLKFDAVSMLLWPSVLVVDLLAIGLALFTASLVAVAAVLVLTLAMAGVWMFRLPSTLDVEFPLLVVLGGFALFFFAGTAFVASRLRGRLATAATSPLFGNPQAQLPAFSALLPFALLVMMTQRLPLANPSPVFGLALLLGVLVVGLSTLMTIEWLPACALAGVTALEYVWQAGRFQPRQAGVAIGWYLLFHVLFAVFPFVFRRRFIALSGPWIVGALSGVTAFPLVYWSIERTWPNGVMGLLPAAFALVPLASLVAVLRAPAATERARLNQLAWFGGIALLFITLIFPIQFERQWLTLAWALEGAALLWLLQRVPHPGLRLTGVVLLATAFVRLAFNPAVLEYHARSETALLNWYLYSYGIVIASLFVGAHLLRTVGDRVLGMPARPLLNTLGTVLAFFLLNIEIADFFSPPGARVLTFQFSGNFARDMTYTIAWSLFALGLLLFSLRRMIRAGRYAALALLGVAALKLFLHDLARLDSLYRIGALFGVAVVAIAASFAYQRFLPADEEPPKS